jgi:hypothetical protein
MYRTVSTPFIYRPRARPARGIPPRLERANASPGLRMSPDWRVHENLIAARMQGSPRKDIVCKVRCPPPLRDADCNSQQLIPPSKIYTPASHVLCIRRAIPYHVTFTGPAQALATLLTYLPSRMGAAPVRACSRIQVLRQTSVDARYVFSSFL